jgi:hypothetical protein
MDARDRNRAIPEIPRELVGSTPRKVRLAGNGLIFGGMFALFLVLAIVAIPSFCIHAIKQAHNRAALRRDGQDAVGVVTKMRFGGRASMPSVSYAFSANGKAFTGWAFLPHGPVDLHESGPIVVRFFRADPKINHPVQWEWSVLMETPSIAGLILFGTCGAIYLASLYRERKLATTGIPADGIVESCVRKNRVYWLKYRFSTKDGKEREGKGYCDDPQKSGTRIWILYLPRNPGRNGVYPLSNYKIEE